MKPVTHAATYMSQYWRPLPYIGSAVWKCKDTPRSVELHDKTVGLCNSVMSSKQFTLGYFQWYHVTSSIEPPYTPWGSSPHWTYIHDEITLWSFIIIFSHKVIWLQWLWNKTWILVCALSRYTKLHVHTIMNGNLSGRDGVSSHSESWPWWFKGAEHVL